MVLVWVYSLLCFCLLAGKAVVAFVIFVLTRLAELAEEVQISKSFHFFLRN